MTKEQKTLVIKENPTPEEVKQWFKAFVIEWNIMFHPDDPASCYTNSQGKKTFTKEEGRLLDDSISRIFSLHHQNTYKLCLEVYRELEAEKKL